MPLQKFWSQSVQHSFTLWSKTSLHASTRFRKIRVKHPTKALQYSKCDYEKNESLRGKYTYCVIRCFQINTKLRLTFFFCFISVLVQYFILQSLLNLSGLMLSTKLGFREWFREVFFWIELKTVHNADVTVSPLRKLFGQFQHNMNIMDVT